MQVKVWFQNRRTKNRRNVDETTPGGLDIHGGSSNDQAFTGAESDMEDDISDEQQTSTIIGDDHHPSTSDPDDDDFDENNDNMNYRKSLMTTVSVRQAHIEESSATLKSLRNVDRDANCGSSSGDDCGIYDDTETGNDDKLQRNYRVDQRHEFDVRVSGRPSGSARSWPSMSLANSHHISVGQM